MKWRPGILLAFGLFICMSPLPLLAQVDVPDTVRVYYLGGQSNMDGFGYTHELPDELKQINGEVSIFHGNPVGDDLPDGGLGIWDQLQPGHGAGFESDGLSNMLSDRFGVELTLARKLQELYPGEKIALIKYSRGGSSIDSLATGVFGCWEPDFQGSTGINQYDHFLKTVRTAMNTRDIDLDGKEDILVRASLRSDDLPVVLGKISDSWNDQADGKVWDHGELVQYAQEKYTRTDGHAGIVQTTRYYKYSDPWHYDSEGYLDLGTRFAESMYELSLKNK